MKGCSNYKVARETFYDLSTWRQQTRNRQQIAVCFMASKSQKGFKDSRIRGLEAPSLWKRKSGSCRASKSTS